MAAKKAGRLLTAQEVADFLQCKICTVRRMVSDGQIPCIRVNQRLQRFDLDKVMSALGARSCAG
jgi:excisionase family DNA binding protein